MTVATISNETIQAIASLWKLVAAVAFLLAIIFLRKPLQQVFKKIRNLRIRKGETELSMETGTTDTPEDVPPQDEKKQEPAEPVRAEELTPKEPGDLFFEMYQAFTDGKFEEADQAFESLQKAEEEAADRLRNQAVYHWLMYRHGRDTNAVQKLEDLAKKKDIRETALFWIANCHEHSRSYAKAIDTYSRALSGDISQSDRSQHTVGLAKCHVTMGNPGKGLQVLASTLAQVTELEAKTALYRAIADVHEKTGNSTLQAIALQKVLEFVPENTSILFSAAYSQSKAKLRCLCVLNYRTLLGFQPTDYSGLNNLGVECDTLDLPIKSVSYYKRAVERGNTLAMSNLAYRYMKQGFETEAQQLLDRARKEDKPHQNVGQAMSTLADKKEEEAQAWDTITTEGVKQKQFFWAYADAYFLPSDRMRPFVGQWTSPTGKVFTVSQEGDRLSGEWETEQEGEKFEGTVHHLAATIKYQRKGTGVAFLARVRWGSAQEGFAYLSQDGSRMHLHTSEKRTTFFLELKKKATEEHPTNESSTTSG